MLRIVSLEMFLYLEMVDIREEREKKGDSYLSLLRMSAVSFYESLCEQV